MRHSEGTDDDGGGGGSRVDLAVQYQIYEFDINFHALQLEFHQKQADFHLKTLVQLQTERQRLLLSTTTSFQQNKNRFELVL